jgi:[ribosomal protein S5]-alanine N-acetyltransferase
MEMPVIETPRLLVRPFVADDLPVIHRILDVCFGDGSKVGDPAALSERAAWLNWQIASYEQLAKLHQPPYGDRGIVLRASGELIGAVGYAPGLMPFEQLPSLHTGRVPPGIVNPEFDMFWAIDPAHQGRGYATEAARGMIEHAFRVLRLRRVLATTEHDNFASQAVMRKLGMRLERNPLSHPHYLQVVGILDNPEI